MYSLSFTRICFLQTVILFCASAQDDETTGVTDKEHIKNEFNQDETQSTVPDTQPHFTVIGETTTQEMHNPKHRFISDNEKPSIFGSHAYNPITQEFEKLSKFNESLAHNTSAFHHHSPHTTASETESVTPSSTKSFARTGRYRVFKNEFSEETDPERESTSPRYTFDSPLMKVSDSPFSMPISEFNDSFPPDDSLNNLKLL